MMNAVCDEKEVKKLEIMEFDDSLSIKSTSKTNNEK